MARKRKTPPANDPVITVACLKQGTKYPVAYVDTLAAMVRRHAAAPFDFVCFTDDPSGIDPSIRTAPLPFAAPGWWGKMGLFMERLPAVKTARLLYLDLDVVITGPLDGLFRHESDFAMARDWPAGTFPAGDPRERDGNSSVVLLKIGAAAGIWERYRRDGSPTGTSGSDQTWINDHFPGMADLLPENLVQSYKLHRLADRLPECSVVMFHGLPKPPDCGGWVKERWR